MNSLNSMYKCSRSRLHNLRSLKKLSSSISTYHPVLQKETDSSINIEKTDTSINIEKTDQQPKSFPSLLRQSKLMQVRLIIVKNILFYKKNSTL